MKEETPCCQNKTLVRNSNPPHNVEVYLSHLTYTIKPPPIFILCIYKNIVACTYTSMLKMGGIWKIVHHHHSHLSPLPYRHFKKPVRLVQ